MTDAGQSERAWTTRQRLAWWLKIAALVVPISFGLAGGAVSCGVWALTRASNDDLDKKADRAEVALVSSVLANVRDNLIMLMERQKMSPKPLPTPAPLVVEP